MAQIGPNGTAHESLATAAHDLSDIIADDVRRALAEDIGSGDVTAALIKSHTQLAARVVTRDAAVLAGRPWAESVWQQVDPALQITWHANDGDQLQPDQTVFEISGNARSVLSGERNALNFLQCLSATATTTRRYVDLVAGTGCRILDTRKTLPGLRRAQKYAVLCGGGHNHRIGLFDAYLIKENHIAAAGSIVAAVTQAKQNPDALLVEVEVENLDELDQALQARADRVLLDNFSIADLETAVERCKGRAETEASGGITDERLHRIASTGVDFISVGALTKSVTAIDLSMRFVE